MSASRVSVDTAEEVGVAHTDQVARRSSTVKETVGWQCLIAAVVVLFRCVQPSWQDYKRQAEGGLPSSVLGQGAIFKPAQMQVPNHMVEMKRKLLLEYISAERLPETSQHLHTVEVKCNVVDKRILKVLKFLCGFNIRTPLSTCGEQVEDVDGTMLYRLKAP